MAASDLIPDLETAVEAFQSTVDVKQSTIDGKVTSGKTARDGAQTAKDAASTAKDAAQVSLNTAYRNTQSTLAVTGYQDLSEVVASKTDGAVDVFIYDTSKDSDGGAWRYRTTNTSWYNETLNTTTRGSRREFPAVAVIVAESNRVKIYDGDDPSLPMWMVFNNGVASGAYKFMITGGLTSVTAHNGMFVVGRFSLVAVDFIGDRAQYIANNSVSTFSDEVISGRNLFSSIADNKYWLTDQFLVAGNVNDVAMTVLPDAPIDPATGLPIPTIALATNGGVSVIKDDGSVTDGSYTGLHNSLAFTYDNALWQQFGAYNIVTPYSVWSVGSSYNSFGNTYWDGTNNFPVRPINADLVSAGSSFEAVGAETGPNLGIQIIKRGTPLREGSKAAYITSTYNTGWMNGDIKGAFLSDTDDTDISDTELVVNGTFDTDTTGWTAIRDAIISVNANRLEVVMGPTAYPVANQYISAGITEGRVYKIEATLTAPASRGARIFIGNSGASTAYTDILRVSAGTTETVSTVFTATSDIANSGWINVGVDIGGVTGDTAYFDNISVKEVAADRSVNNNPLTINGTITRTPVATGAELVGYSGFSASNYLEQAYNSGLDFGTGDFCVMGWSKTQNNTYNILPTISHLYDDGSGRTDGSCFRRVVTFASDCV